MGDDGYNFKDESTGSGVPTGWDTAVTASSTILSEAGDPEHKQVWAFGPCIALFPGGYYHDWGATRETGVVEFYYMNYDVSGSDICAIIITDTAESGNSITANTHVGAFSIHDTKFKVYDSASAWADIAGAPTPEDEKWYHVSIVFNSSAGNFTDPIDSTDLAAGKFRIWIDRTKYGDYDQDSADNPDKVEIWQELSGTAVVGLDAFAFSWDATYDVGDNMGFITETAMTTGNVYKSVVTGTVMDYRKAVMSIDEDEEIQKGHTIQITYTYSVGGATASGVIFEGMVTSMTTSKPYECVVESLAKEDLKDKPAIGAQESGRTDQIVTAQTADINHISDGTHENGEAMGTLTFGGTKTYRQIY